MLLMYDTHGTNINIFSNSDQWNKIIFTTQFFVQKTWNNCIQVDEINPPKVTERNQEMFSPVKYNITCTVTFEKHFIRKDAILNI